MGRVSIISEERVFDSYLKVDKANVEHELNDGEKATYSRFKLTRPDAVVALVCNLDEQKVIMVRQFRYPVASTNAGENILEAVAGKIDAGEDPKQALVRELEEEIGYRVPEEKLDFICEAYVSPGYTTEKFHLFIVQVTNDMRVSDGGGLATEHEDIELVEIPLDDFIDLFKNGELRDAKTIMLAQALIIKSVEHQFNW